MEAREPDILQKAGKLHKATLELITPYEILTNKKLRNKITSVLLNADAEELAQTLNMKICDVYKDLERMQINKGTKTEENLLKFFEVDVPKIETITTRPNIEKIDPSVGLFEHQRQVVRDTMRNLETEPHRTIIHMPTGAGKTRIAMKIITQHLLKREPVFVIWLAYSEELCEQAIEEFNKNWRSVGDRMVKVYRFFGKHAMKWTDKMTYDGLLVASLE